MTKTQALRTVVVSQLNGVGITAYYRKAPNTAEFPYAVFNFVGINNGDTARDDMTLEIDLYDHDRDAKDIEDLADTLEEHLRFANLPNGDILPTFWADNRVYVEDADKDIQHLVLNYTVQNYKK